MYKTIFKNLFFLLMLVAALTGNAQHKIAVLPYTISGNITTVEARYVFGQIMKKVENSKYYEFVGPTSFEDDVINKNLNPFADQEKQQRELGATHLLHCDFSNHIDNEYHTENKRKVKVKDTAKSTDSTTVYKQVEVIDRYLNYSSTFTMQVRVYDVATGKMTDIRTIVGSQSKSELLPPDAKAGGIKINAARIGGIKTGIKEKVRVKYTADKKELAKNRLLYYESLQPIFDPLTRAAVAGLVDRFTFSIGSFTGTHSEVKITKITGAKKNKVKYVDLNIGDRYKKNQYLTIYYKKPIEVDGVQYARSINIGRLYPKEVKNSKWNCKVVIGEKEVFEKMNEGVQLFVKPN